MRLLLDTNACIALINGRPQSVRRHLERALRKGDEVATSSIVLYELWYGVAKSKQSRVNAERLATFLGGPIDVHDFTVEDADHAGRVRAELELTGKPIGAYDVLIAGQALRLGAALVTSNSNEFSRVKGLRSEDWS